MTVLEILRAARELIGTPEKWTKGCGARDIKGQRTDWRAPDVYCRCLMVAIAENCGGMADEERAAKAIGFRDQSDVISWNDQAVRTHAEVLSRLDSAIQAEEAKVTRG